MIALDTNVLVHAHRRESPWHVVAESAVRDLAESGRPWAIPWPCVGEFLSVVTNRRLFEETTPVDAAVRQVEFWAESPSLHWLGESTTTWPVLRGLLLSSSIGAARVHDARIAAICVAHGVRELWTADRDYGRFPALRTRNPLAGRG